MFMGVTVIDKTVRDKVKAGDALPAKAMEEEAEEKE